MKQVLLETSLREGKGKKLAKKLRKSGMVPAVIYGKDFEAMSIEIPEKDFSRGLTTHGTNALFNIKIGENSYTAIVHEVQRAPLSKEIFHVDFYKVSLDTKIQTSVPIKLEGESRGVKAGGILEQIMWELQIEVLPLEIPEHIVVDVTSLNIDSEIRVKEISCPENITIVSDPEEVVVAVKTLRAEEEVAETEEAAAEPEVIKKGKEEEE